MEVYSDLEGELSALASYREFMEIYADIIDRSVAMLKPNRFACFVVGDVRDKNTGFYRNFVGDTITAFLDAGMHYYNEAILVKPAGTLPLRCKGPFGKYRKLGKMHQNILVFYKGNNQKDIPSVFPHLDDDTEVSE